MVKPPTGQDCNHCGTCCKSSLCEPAELLFENEQCVSAPCPCIINHNGQVFCGLMVAESFLPKDKRLITNGLGAGVGCTMED